MYYSTASLSWTLDGGGWSTPRPGRIPPPRKTRYPIVQEAGWAAGPVWTSAEKSRPHRDSIPGPPSPYQVTIPATDSSKVNPPIWFGRILIYKKKQIIVQLKIAACINRYPMALPWPLPSTDCGMYNNGTGAT